MTSFSVPIVSLNERGESGFFGILEDGRAYSTDVPIYVDDTLKFGYAYVLIQEMADKDVTDLSFERSNLELSYAQYLDQLGSILDRV